MLTLILFKPDCVRRGLVGECLSRFERRGFQIAAIRRFYPGQVEAKLLLHYAEHADKPYFGDLFAMMTSGPIVACAVIGEDAINAARRIAGPYREPIPGTIRGDFATSQLDNVVHTSDGPESADREVDIWFPDFLEYYP
jgi:nucleoside-diphosphate kinase